MHSWHKSTLASQQLVPKQIRRTQQLVLQRKAMSLPLSRLSHLVWQNLLWARLLTLPL
jgi:hypothetical protein